MWMKNSEFLKKKIQVMVNLVYLKKKTTNFWTESLKNSSS